MAVDTLLHKYRYPDGSQVIDRFARRTGVDEASVALARVPRQRRQHLW